MQAQLPSVSGVLQALPAEELTTAARNVEALKASPGWAFLEKLTDHGERVLIQQMVSGSPKDHAAYAHLAGRMLGLQTVRTSAEQVLDFSRAVERQLSEGGQHG